MGTGYWRFQSRFVPALAVCVALGAAYTWLHVAQPPEPFFSLLAFLPGLVSVATLAAAGATRGDLYLRFAPLSKTGALALAAATLLLLPILGANSGLVGWQWLPALVYAPASGIAQELYFRSALLPGLELALNGRRRAALLAHVAVFVAFHAGTFLLLPSVPVALLVAAVLALGGLVWGWQVQRDRTVVWAMAQHSAFLMLMSLFAYG